jgi:hypothetical protein
LPQLLPRNELAGIPDQDRQRLDRAALHRQPDLSAAQLPRPQVQFEGAEPDDLVGVLWLQVGPKLNKPTISSPAARGMIRIAAKSNTYGRIKLWGGMEAGCIVCPRPAPYLDLCAPRGQAR